MHFWLNKRRGGRLALATAGAAALTVTLAVVPAHASVAALTAPAPGPASAPAPGPASAPAPGPASAPAPSPTPASTPRLTTNTDAPCNVTPRPGFVRCLAVVRTTAAHNIMAASSNQPPATALGPADLQSAYHLPALGAGQTVAIVDANGDSKAESDLATFRAQYGLPPCTAANGCFRKVDQAGGTNYPPDDPGWALETSLDLDAVSAACPKCNILLVQGNSPSVSDLAAAVDEAVTLGAKFVSNSYGAPDGSADSYNASYSHSGVAIVASSGDTGYIAEWPSALPVVTAVGGTLLTKDSAVSRGWDETAWDSGGSGCSATEAQPDFQAGLNTDCSMRAVADISADADPASGLATYDTLGENGWLQVGGTSLAAPLITAMYAMAGTPESGSYPVSYAYHDKNPAADLFDVTQGSNGSCGTVLCTAGPGWDGPTGLGTPDGLGALSSGPQSVITGQATDATTGKPLAGVTVTASPGGYQTQTDAGGKFELDVTAGSYTVTGSLYAYQSAMDSVQATANQTATANLSLAELPHTTLTGTVRDGSGHGWPVYAKIIIGGGYPGAPVYTDPFTGKYSVILAAPSTYPVTVSAAAPTVDAPPGDGYQTLSSQVTAGSSSTTRADFTLSADKTACIAPGYGYPGLNEHFTSWTQGTPRDGWTVTGSRDGWRFDNPGNRPPPTMTTGNDTFAIADSGTSGGYLNSTLTSPAIDLSGQLSPELSFQSEYYGAPGQQGTIELSTDGGGSWTPIWHHTTDDVVSTSPYTTIAIPAAAGKHDVRIRFRYSGDDAWWWSVGNVHVGDPGCTALPGGLVSGLVTDAGTGQAVAGASVTSTTQPGVSGFATGTGDTAVNGALYSVFSPATGSQGFTATAAGYSSSTASVNVTADQLTRQDFALTASATAAAATRHVTSAKTASAKPAPEPAGQPPAGQLPAGQLQPVALPGLHGTSYTITLITGDQVHLQTTGAGRYTVNATPSAVGGDQGVRITGIATAKGTTSLQAMPSLALPLMTAGQVDPGLFDLAWLAAHGDTGSGAELPVVLQSATAAGTAAVAKTAAAVPGVKVTGVSAAADTVQVTVSAGDAAAFWSAITGTRAARPGQPATGLATTGLADGITGIWLADHRTATASPQRAAERLAADQRLYTVTETIIGPAPATGLGCGPQETLCISPIDQGMFGVSGAAADTGFPAASFVCSSQTAGGPCTAYQVTYQVPAGIYLVDGFANVDQGSDTDGLDMTIPQLAVIGDTSFTIDVNKARKLAVTTPRPSSSVSFATQEERVTPDGTAAFGGTIFFYGFQNEWVVRTGGPVTVGTFNFSAQWLREAPVITMSVGGSALNPYYPYYVDDPADPAFKRFTGSQTRQLVAAGIGSAADFARVDVRGKLALVGLDPAAGGCIVEGSQITNALNAGAAGVIIDPTLPSSVVSDIGSCWMPIIADWMVENSGNPPQLPFVSVPEADATHLRQLLAGGPVSITVTDSGTPAYQYDLKFYTEGGMPADPGYTVTTRDLAQVDTSLHSDVPSLVDWSDAANWPDERFIIRSGAKLHSQAAQTQYYGPLSPAEVWQRSPEVRTGEQSATGIFSQRGRTTDDWFSRPATPGAVTVSPEISQAQPGLWEPEALCAFCRQGDVFYPIYYQVGQDPSVQDGAYIFDASKAHLYAGGQEIQPVPAGGVPAYTLPSGPTNYRFTMTRGNTTTDWSFGSATPTATHIPASLACAGTILVKSTAPCAPMPLILLRYNAFTNPANGVTAGGPHQIDVTPYYQDGGSAASITSLRLWISTDGGTTWQEVHVTRHAGSYTGRYQLPARAAAGGSVSLRAQATDSADTTVSQIVLNGYSIIG